MLDLTNSNELEKLVRQLTPVPGTYPPVYMLGSVLIGYDRREQIKVLAGTVSQPVETKQNWLGRVFTSVGRLSAEAYAG
jgi:hypothetical protein